VPGGQRYALLVGVQQYDSPELPDLHYSESDVEELAEVLLASGYPAGNVALLTGKKGAQDRRALPTAAGIRAALDGLLKKCRKNDLVLVAFAGHGIELKETKKYYFCPLGARLADPATLVSLNEVYDRLKGCAAAYKLLLADACRNDPGSRGPRVVPEEANVPSVTRPQFAPPPGGVMAFYSCSPSQYAYEPDDLKHGVFFHFVIEGLRGPADLDGDGEVIREELEAYVKKKVRSYAVEKLKREQWPHLLGESNDQRPLVKLPEGAKPPPAAAARPKITRRELVAKSRVLLAEDFHRVADGKLPEGWNGRDLYGVFKDNKGRPCVRPTGKRGVEAPLTLPETVLTGDFYVEVEFCLENYHDDHFLHLRLETLGESLPLTVGRDGHVTLADKPARQADGFDCTRINRVRLVREGRFCRVSVNDSVVIAVPIAYRGDYQRLHLTLPAGKHFGGEGQDAKVYAVRVGLMPSLDGAGDGSQALSRKGRVLLEEDFTGVRDGDVPRGWGGRDVVIVQRPDADRVCLEANEKMGQHFITLPPLPLSGDFFVEVEFNLANYHDDHKLEVRLEGRGVTLPVVVDHSGTVTLPDRPPRTPESFPADKNNRFRLIREGVVYRVSLNDIALPANPLPYRGDFQRVQLGLSAGHHFGPTMMKILAVRIGVLDAPGDAAAAPPVQPMPDQPQAAKPAGLEEDFRSTKEGELPKGWSAAAGTVGVRKDGGKAALEVTDPAGGGVVALPAVSLKGDFDLECVFAMPDKETSVQVQLEAGPGKALLLVVLGDGKVALMGRPVDAAKALAKPGEANRLRLERVEGSCAVTLNDKRIGQLPAGAAPWEFEGIKLGLALKAAKNTSPKVYSIRATPAGK
jgi:hypothetical protein